MNRKIHAQSVLQQLTEDQQETLYDWLLVDTYRAVQTRLAAAPPEGFGLKVHLMSLQRFFKRRRLETRADWVEELSISASDEAKEEAKILDAAEQSLTARAYELASTGQSLEEMDQAAWYVGTVKRMGLKQGYLRVAEEHLRLAKVQAELEREKFEINTARLALEHAAKLKEIIHNPALDDEDKIRQSRRVVFTKIPEDELTQLPVQTEKVSSEV
jgi:hypothetical protein